MCLAVPGKIISIQQKDGASDRLATIDLQGNRLEASLVLTPEASEGDWVLVHAGFAIQTLDEEEARQTWEYLQAVLDAGDELSAEPSES